MPKLKLIFQTKKFFIVKKQKIIDKVQYLMSFVIYLLF
ncbi:hypothetical protein BC748_2305 [Flavobacterium dankookense]|uniref:Uncharacterized protein n=1 Tax=Flavobacterium dankookense TaxID=706186 RepID=A0A4R6Q6Y9_9FLAO|nr:hypothetical protein BC748_2305 [Flavobacterium dankookense]